MISECTQEEIKFRNPVKQLGYGMVYHAITLDTRISHGAYRLFNLYVMHAQQKDMCHPGVERLADMLDTSTRSVERYNKELTSAGYVTRDRRMGTSSITWIEDYEQNPYLVSLAKELIAGRKDKAKLPSSTAARSRQTRRQNNNKVNKNKPESLTIGNNNTSSPSSLREEESEVAACAADASNIEVSGNISITRKAKRNVTRCHVVRRAKRAIKRTPVPVIAEPISIVMIDIPVPDDEVIYTQDDSEMTWKEMLASLPPSVKRAARHRKNGKSVPWVVERASMERYNHVSGNNGSHTSTRGNTLVSRAMKAGRGRRKISYA